MKTIIALFCMASLMSLSLAANADISALLGKEVKIINVNSGKALTVPGMSQENGTELIQYEYLGNADQKWKIESVTGNQYKITNMASNKVVEIADQGTENGDLARQWQFFDVPHHKWNITSVGSNAYRIENLNSGKALEIKDGGTANNDIVRQWQYSSVAHHQWEITEASSAQQDVVLQAESASTSGGAVSNDGSAQGGSYFDLKDNGRVDFNVSVASAGTYSVIVKYRSQYGDKRQNILVNNSVVEEALFAAQDNWTDIEKSVQLNAGSNTFSIQASWGYSDIDQITVVGSGSDGGNDGGSSRVEAENATLVGDTNVYGDSAASGGQFAQIDASGSITFNVSVASEGNYDIKIAYQSPWGDKPQHLYIDNIYQSELAFTERNTWGELVASAYLTAGSHDIRIETGWGYIRFDYVEVVASGGGSQPGNPGLYYDNQGISFDYQSGAADERFPSPNGGSIRADYSVNNDSGQWTITTVYTDGSKVSTFTFNMESGVVTEYIINSGNVLEDETYQPNASDLTGYVSTLKGMRPNFELQNAQDYVQDVIDLLDN